MEVVQTTSRRPGDHERAVRRCDAFVQHRDYCLHGTSRLLTLRYREERGMMPSWNIAIVDTAKSRRTWYDAFMERRNC